MTAPTCGWNPTSFSPDCDWDPTCPQHGDTMTAEQRLIAYLCQRAGTEHMDAHHASMARQILAQHAGEIAASRRNSPSGRTEGLDAIQLADMLRDASTALARLDRKEIENTDDPLTLMRCLYETVEALAEIAPHALTAARLDPQAAAPSGTGVADIPGRVTVGLGSASAALWDAYNSI